MYIADFNIITEYIIVSYLQTRNACLLTFTLLYLQQIVFAGV